MIPMSADALAVLGGSFVMHVRVESWRGEDALADDIPVAAAMLEGDRSLRVPDRLTLTVPRVDRGATWDPQGDSAHPLAAWGQRVKVSVGIETAPDVVEWIERGWFLIVETVADGDTVSVEAAGLLALLDEARFVSPFQPSGTMGGTLRALVEPALTVDLTAAPTDRAVPARMAWDEDRLGAVHELLDAWGADAEVSTGGFLVVTSAAESTTPVGALTDGAGGTVVRWAGGASRADAASLVVARGQAADGKPVQGVAYETTGPTAYGGPFSPLPVPAFIFSPLLTTNAQCRTAANTVLLRRRRGAGRRVTASAVPLPTVELGDVIAVTGAGLSGAPCAVEAFSLPLVADGGAMTLSLREVLP